MRSAGAVSTAEPPAARRPRLEIFRQHVGRAAAVCTPRGAWCASAAANWRSTRAASCWAQSLPLSGPAFYIGNRVLSGARVLVDRMIAVPARLAGLGHRAGDAGRATATRACTADNVRTLECGSMARWRCSTAWTTAPVPPRAEASFSLGVPLVGPLTDAEALREGSVRHVFTLRPDDRLEVQAWIGHLKAIGDLACPAAGRWRRAAARAGAGRHAAGRCAPSGSGCTVAKRCGRGG